MTQPIPALIVSGFLGAGKTTLVSHLLAQARAEGVKLAIISNEFGDTGIDRALLDGGNEDFVELDGGCICCKLSDAVPDTIRAIIDAVHPDRIVLETSGVALPGELVLQFWRPPLSELLSDEVVVIVVDAERAAAESMDETFVEQLESADLILLNKVDLVGAEALARATAHVAKLSAGQPVLYALNAEVDPARLFPPDPEGARAARRDPDAQLHAHTHAQFSTKELTFPPDMPAEQVLDAVRAEGAVRAKGFVQTAEGVRVLQGVGPRLSLDEPRAPVDPAMLGRVVIIHHVEGSTVHAHD